MVSASPMRHGIRISQPIFRNITPPVAPRRPVPLDTELALPLGQLLPSTLSALRNDLGRLAQQARRDRHSEAVIALNQAISDIDRALARQQRRALGYGR
jgi:hypothetical protein